MFRRITSWALIVALGLSTAGIAAAAGRHVHHYPAYFGAAKGIYSVPHGPHHPMPR